MKTQGKRLTIGGVHAKLAPYQDRGWMFLLHGLFGGSARDDLGGSCHGFASRVGLKNNCARLKFVAIEFHIGNLFEMLDQAFLLAFSGRLNIIASRTRAKRLKTL
jgi:hypothetical protein